MSVAAIMPLSNGHIAYDVRGPANAPSILLLRSAGGSMTVWGRFRDLLAEQLRVISFDPRGQGRSSPAPLWWSVDEMVADALELLDLLGLERTHVFGISMGGMVALRLAIDHPARVDHLILASTVDRGTIPSWRSAMAGARVARCLLAPDEEVQSCAVDHTTTDDTPFTQRARDDARRLPPQRSAIVSYGVAAMRHDVRDELSRIASPTLVLGGKRDPLTPPRITRTLARRIPGARLRLLDSGHDLAIERPHATARAVLSFLLDDQPSAQPDLRGEASP